MLYSHSIKATDKKNDREKFMQKKNHPVFFHLNFKLPNKNFTKHFRLVTCLRVIIQN